MITFSGSYTIQHDLNDDTELGLLSLKHKRSDTLSRETLLQLKNSKQRSDRDDFCRNVERELESGPLQAFITTSCVFGGPKKTCLPCPQRTFWPGIARFHRTTSCLSTPFLSTVGSQSHSLYTGALSRSRLDGLQATSRSICNYRYDHLHFKK